ncbi:hypothetical protein TI39_contig411g00007 [Zymoseptoria brevis]|uniref:Uncharacterized protein n=1 Tax=Zymoseptoria brevis TaxID=1047168 RepID=A0A0F4GQL7_9PEZI|nr:hypothetical protein TI39_contig411g00007 [Zymoseptoria brevis]
MATFNGTSNPTHFLAGLKSYLSEAHPFERPSVLYRPHAVPWKPYFVRLGRAAPMYTLGMAAFLLWPFAAKGLINASNMVGLKPLAKKSKR